MSQITGAIIGITLVLVAVFVPMAFLPGSVGIIYRQFSVAMVVVDRLFGLPGAVADAGAVRDASQAGRRPATATPRGGFFGWFNRALDGMTPAATVARPDGWSPAPRASC